MKNLNIPIDLQVTLVEVGALIEQYAKGRNNVVFHVIFIVFMLSKVVWWYIKRFKENKALKQIEVNAELDRLRKLEEIKMLQKYNTPDTAKEELDKIKRLREQLFKNTNDNNK